MPSFVYVIGITAVFVLIALPRSRQIHLHAWFVIWTAIYAACKFLFFDETLLDGGGYIYITITEMAFLLFIILLAYRITLHLQDFEEAVINISFSGIKERILGQENGWNAMQTEINRGRRYQRPVSVVAIEPEPSSVEAALHRSVREVQQAMMSRYVFMGLARIVSQQMRRMDLAVEQEGKNRLLIVCPETDQQSVEGLMQRIKQIAHQQLGLSIGYGIASFPDAALTAEQLVKQAEHNIQHYTTLQAEHEAYWPQTMDNTIETDSNTTKEIVFQDG
jgi:hypothetical protein